MKIFIFTSLSCILLCVVVSPVLTEKAVSRRQTLSLLRGFLCYLKGISIEDCKNDRDVNSVIANIINDQFSDEDKTDDSNRLLPAGLAPSSSFPLPPAGGARKRDAFYSDWKRK